METLDRRNVAEGGCGVLGVASSTPIKGKHLLRSMIQMRNRGNGKGGGVAAVSLSSRQLGVSARTLEECYLLQVAYLDPSSRKKIEAESIYPNLSVELAEKIPTLEDYGKIGLEVRPPDVWRYFVRPDEEKLQSLIEKGNLQSLAAHESEDEFIYRNSFALNKKHYASLSNKKAFVLSHGKNIMVLKIVGYAEQVIKYYLLEDLEAQVWVCHQRYPTKGKIWHPGGSHPFIGMHDALVHNGDFANYHSIAEYLKQRDIYPLFLTDTEVAALYWDLLTRVYRYPLEYAIEAMAPTTERDFAMLPEEKRRIYRAIQATHIHGSPDGPWFFIVASRNPTEKEVQLIGITDTSMLRPQVFALQEGRAKIGLIASEKQAIHAILEDLARDDRRFSRTADIYWHARGGSYTDGGAFVFTIDASGNLKCTDKFGSTISAANHQSGLSRTTESTQSSMSHVSERAVIRALKRGELADYIVRNVSHWHFDQLSTLLDILRKHSESDRDKTAAIEALTLLIDRRYDTGDYARRDMIPMIEEQLFEILDSAPTIDSDSRSSCSLINRETMHRLRNPFDRNQILIVDASDFDPEGEEGTCQLVENAYRLGWRRFIAYNFRGQRNFGAGIVARDKVRIDVFGRVGDCLAAFADGPEFYVHESAQDSVAYCFKSGKLVIYGDAGKAFGYGAKGGVAFVLGDLIDRPLINSVGSATAVINGSCKDYMGESCMAANGFIILNGMTFDQFGRISEQDTPYHGGNLFPLAAAGTAYLRDPRRTVSRDQLEGAKLARISQKDYLERILPSLKENERLFGISVERLLTVNGEVRSPEEVYRKVVPVQISALAKYEIGI